MVQPDAPVAPEPVVPEQAAPEATPAVSPWKTLIDARQEGTSILEKQIARMQAMLERRSSLPFDPALMKLSAGLLAPTKTGGFGESLGVGMNAYSEESQNQIERDQKLEAMKLDLAQKMVDQRRKNATMQIMGQMYAGTQPALAGDTAQGAEPQVAGQPAQAPTRSRVTVTPEMVAAADMSGDPEFAKAIHDQMDIQQKAIEQQVKQQTADQSNTTARTLPGVGKTELSAQQWNAYTAAKQSGDPEKIRGWYEENGLPFRAELIGGKLNFLSMEDVDAIKARNVKQAEANVARGETLFSAPGDTSNDRIIAAQNIKSLAESNAPIFNIMKGMGLTDSIARMAKTGVHTPWGDIGFDATELVRQAVKNSGQKISDADYAALQMAAQNFAQLQIAASKLAQGQGSISDYERHLFASIGISGDDNAQSMRMKSIALQRRAEFDRDAAEKWAVYRDTTNKSPDSFKATPEYKQLISQYNDDLKSLRESNAAELGGKPPAAASSSSSSGKTLVQRLAEQAQKRSANP